MRLAETEIEMVERHVRGGKLHVARQQKIVAAFRTRIEHLSAKTLELAEWTLKNLEEIQLEHEAHLCRLNTERLARKPALLPKV